ncbi:hypothetical protein LEP1GSC034_0213 [Leptospira interrogans str. 2003000735]|uniref:DUF2634 domain-containing protein n=2 Tax=Leptospira interrogans TaxID=173 RepID=A0A829DAT3_LEPIR|nr:hypothetical protein [Leptospira interrogans]EMY05346.1 hypothetical protein LEP1GSC029_3355 [Leptospira interrogans str. 2002000626]EMY24738.1 hypothetical protein LEP1GSC115_0392 [Leptospira interrogans serovar Australis str. 200703203]EKN88954.1 hypothetical protein LEP1GSC027_4170 [Leptospira interrogans str. 2002000624]EKQ36900.1 hypothetical protein LEP1GSC025_0796 [Leptospira interrogans str. 2002000621]EKQ49814.1 hypothetical protein LEP1GSC026_4704 [Leptospira interrogans str. 2002
MNTFLIQDRDLKPVKISGPDCLKQRLENRFRLWKGEWEYDKQIGFAWDNVIRRNPIVKDVESLVRSELRKDPEVVSVESVEVIFIDTEEKAIQYEKSLRTAIIRYVLTSTYGALKGEI